MKNCLITGATGLIGSHLLPDLIKKYNVYAITHKKKKPSDFQNIRIISLDLSSNWVETDLPKDIDIIIHLAQSEYFREFPEYAEDVFKTNTLSTLKLLNYSKKIGVKKFIYASSAGIYGHHEKEFTEDKKILLKHDLGFYLGTKLCSEIVAENYTQYMDVIILRFFFVYGKGQRDTMLIPRLVTLIKEHKPIILQGNNGIRINPIYVTDATVSIMKSIKLAGSYKINVGGPQVLSLRKIGNIIGRILNIKPKFKTYPFIKPQHLIGSIEKMTKLCGAPQVNFEQGINNYISGGI